MILIWLTGGASVSLITFCLCGLLRDKNSGTLSYNPGVSYSRVREVEEESEEEFLIIDKI